jgi:hypothetical protein
MEGTRVLAIKSKPLAHRAYITAIVVGLAAGAARSSRHAAVYWSRQMKHTYLLRNSISQWLQQIVPKSAETLNVRLRACQPTLQLTRSNNCAILLHQEFHV